MTRRAWVPLLIIALLPGVGARAGGAAEPPPPVVRELAVEGARMIAEQTVRARIGTREGEPYDPERVSEDVRQIYDIGAFEDVKVEAEGFEGGVRLVFRLTERPLLRSVEYDGNDKVSTEDLSERAAFVPSAPYNPVAAAQAVARIKALYRERGFYQPVVRTSVEPAGEGRVTLKVVIEEGRRYRLSEIAFRGNRAFTDEQLRDEIKTAEWTIFSWLGSSGKLRQDVLQEDRQRLVTHYQDHGYLEARVGEPEVTVDDAKGRLLVTFPVTEGLQYRLGTMGLQGDDLVPLEEIRRLVGIGEGELFRRTAFAQGLAAISRRYGARGYAYVKVDYRTRLDPEARTIEVVFMVDRGPETRIGRITITGNTATRDKVIRRELTVREGDLFNGDALRRSRQKVMNLGFFDVVDILPRPRGEDLIDIDITVKEKLTGAITFGLGYSSEDKLSGQIRLSESNLFGRGQSLSLLAEYSPVRRNYSLTFSEPAILDGPWSAGFSIYDLLREYDEYDRKSIGGSLTLGRSLWEYTRGSVRLKHETVNVSNIDQETASNYIKEQEGERTTDSVRLSLVRDSRDNYFNPTRGQRTVLSGELAGGPFGGDNYFTKYEIEHSIYRPLFWGLVGMIHGEYGRVQGYDGREPPVYEKYFLGGIFSLRGFPFRKVGPLDENGDPRGGYQELFFNVEVIVPLAPEQGFNLVFFYDTGNAWDKGERVDLGDLRTSAGFGIRWLTPLGPFRLEWGYILDRREGEPKSDWSFIIGNFF